MEKKGAKCQREGCKRVTKELYEITTENGSYWYCKMCAAEFDGRVTKGPRTGKSVNRKTPTNRWGGSQ